MRQNAGTVGPHQFPSSLLSFLCNISLKRETQEARLLSGVVDFSSHVIAHISRGGSRKFRKGWPVQLPTTYFLFF